MPDFALPGPAIEAVGQHRPVAAVTVVVVVAVVAALPVAVFHVLRPLFLFFFCSFSSATNEVV